MPKRTSPGTKRKKHSRILEQINHSAAGIDAGAEWHFVAVPEERATPSVRKFATTTGGLYALADWLAAAGIDTVAVEATGVYCMPLLDVLDGRGLAVVLAKPASLKSVNDRRKTDMLDCQWIQMLHGFGLLRASLRPTQMVAAFRTYSRQRRMLIEQASTAIEHMKKALTSMNIRVELAVSDITGRTGMHIIRAIVAGERETSNSLLSTKVSAHGITISCSSPSARSGWQNKAMPLKKKRTEKTCPRPVSPSVNEKTVCRSIRAPFTTKSSARISRRSTRSVPQRPAPSSRRSAPTSMPSLRSSTSLHSYVYRRDRTSAAARTSPARTAAPQTAWPPPFVSRPKH